MTDMPTSDGYIWRIDFGTKTIDLSRKGRFKARLRMHARRARDAWGVLTGKESIGTDRYDDDVFEGYDRVCAHHEAEVAAAAPTGPLYKGWFC